MRVAIAEDAVLLREGLVRLLSENDCEIVAAVDNGADLVEAVVRERPDVSIVDVRMPPTFRDEGLRAAIEARRRVPNTPILVFSQYVEERYAAELLEGGTNGVGYLLKDRVADVREFIVAVRRVASGGTVLALMAEGRTNNAIADALFVSEGTVEKHIRGIFTKLGLEDAESVHRRVLAVLTFLRLGAEER